jgi:flagellar biosynthesis protein FliR
MKNKIGILATFFTVFGLCGSSMATKIITMKQTLSAADNTKTVPTTQKAPLNNEKPRWSQLLQSYGTSLVSGSLSGLAMGMLSSYAVKIGHQQFKDDRFAQLVTTIAIFLAEFDLRSRITSGLNNSFSEYSIPHEKDATKDVAWIASWIGYFILG